MPWRLWSDAFGRAEEWRLGDAGLNGMFRIRRMLAKPCAVRKCRGRVIRKPEADPDREQRSLPFRRPRRPVLDEECRYLLMRLMRISPNKTKRG